MLEVSPCDRKSITFKNLSYSLEFFINDSLWSDFLAENNHFLKDVAFKAFEAGNLFLDKKRMHHINIIFCDDDYIHGLNHNYRNIDKPTNVLSFPTYDRDELNSRSYCFGDIQIFGDIFIAYQYCIKEAESHKKSYNHHIAHMVIHGILHIMGYDHIDDKDANIMESLEVDILKKFNIPNPYI